LLAVLDGREKQRLIIEYGGVRTAACRRLVAVPMTEHARWHSQTGTPLWTEVVGWHGSMVLLRKATGVRCVAPPGLIASAASRAVKEIP